MAEKETLYTVQEVAKRFSVSYRAILDWIASGEMECYRVGNANAVLRISESQIQEYLENHKTE